MLRRRNLQDFGIHLGCCGWHHYAIHYCQHSVVHFIQEVLEVIDYQILINLKTIFVDLNVFNNDMNWKKSSNGHFFAA